MLKHIVKVTVIMMIWGNIAYTQTIQESVLDVLHNNYNSLLKKLGVGTVIKMNDEIACVYGFVTAYIDEKHASEPVAGAEVRIRRDDGKEWQTTTSGSGYYEQALGSVSASVGHHFQIYIDHPEYCLGGGGFYFEAGHQCYQENTTTYPKEYCY